jgi:hypothetical protein
MRKPGRANRHPFSIHVALREMLQFESHTFRKVCFRMQTGLCGGVYKAEDIVQDVPGAVGALELESLCEAHGLVLASELYQG